MLHRTSQRSALAIVAVLLAAGRTNADPPQPKQTLKPGLGANVEAILESLPADTESLFVARSPFELRAKGAKRTAANVDWSSWEANWHEFVMWQFRSVDDGKLFKGAIGRRVSLVVSAGRSYRAPKDHGLMRYDGCEVIVFEGTSRAVAGELMKAAVATGHAKEEIASHPVALFRLTRQHDEWTLLVANPRPGILLVATDRTFLRETLEGMQSPRKTRALPANLPEWTYVHNKADCWAIRHLNQQGGRALPDALHDGPATIGLVCAWQNEGGTPVMRLVHLTEAKDQADAVRDAWVLVGDEQRAILTAPKVRQLAPRATEVTHRLADLTTTAYAFWVFMLRFGPGLV